MSQFGMLLLRLHLEMPFFAMLFYYCNWLFLGCFAIYSVLAINKEGEKSRHVFVIEEESDDEEEEI